MQTSIADFSQKRGKGKNIDGDKHRQLRLGTYVVDREDLHFVRDIRLVFGNGKYPDTDRTLHRFRAFS